VPESIEWFDHTAADRADIGVPQLQAEITVFGPMELPCDGPRQVFPDWRQQLEKFSMGLFLVAAPHDRRPRD